MDVDVVRSDGIDTNPDIQAEIDECIAYADALRDRGIDARVVVEAIDRDEVEMGTRGLVKGAVEVTYETLGYLVHRFRDHTIEIPVYRVQAIDERIRELEWDNMRLRDMMDVASQRVTQSQRRETREEYKEQIDRRLAGALRAHDTARNLKPLMGNRGNGNGGNRNRGNRNGGNGNGGNGNGNRNEGGNGYNFG
nr:hypothetical protein [Tanacetum cinerariifolium]